MSPHIAIIGCGIIGATIAYELSLTTDYRIDVFDRQPPACESTGAALGVLMGIVSQKFKGRAWQMREHSIRRYHTLIHELERVTGIKIPHNSHGLVKLLSPEDDLSKWVGLANIRSQQQWQIELWDGLQTIDRLPQIASDFNGSAVYSPQDLQVDPIALTTALVEAARLNGVKFHLERSIDSIAAHRPDSCDLIAKDLADLRYNWAIVTAGLGASDLLLPHAPIEIRPVLGQAIQIRLSKPLGSADFQPVTIAQDVNIVPCGGNDYWVGATVEFPTESGQILAQAAELDRLKAIAFATCPGLAAGEIVRSWSGLRPRPHARSAPVIDRVGDNGRILVATGHYRNGILLAPATAKMVGELIIEN